MQRHPIGRKDFFCTPPPRDNKGLCHAVWAIQFENWMTEGYKYNGDYFQKNIPGDRTYILVS